MLKTIRLGVAALALTLSAAAASAAIPKAGGAAPAFSLEKTSGGAVSLASLRGKPIYLNFFASWCGPCNDEAPAVVGLYKRYHPRGLVTLGIDELESKAKAIEFKKKFNEPFDVVVDADGKMGRDYGAIGLPVHVFVDRRGKISTFRLGEMTPGEIEAAIKKIL